MIKDWFRALKQDWQEVSRPAKTGCYVIGILVFGLLWYCFYGAPQFSWEARFRRAEKAELIGPSQILGVIEEGLSVYYFSFGVVVLAEDEDHVIAYGGWNEDLWEMCYRPKMGKVTVLGLVQASNDDTGQKMTGVVAYDYRGD